MLYLNIKLDGEEQKTVEGGETVTRILYEKGLFSIHIKERRRRDERGRGEAAAEVAAPAAAAAATHLAHC